MSRGGFAGPTITRTAIALFDNRFYIEDSPGSAGPHFWSFAHITS